MAKSTFLSFVPTTSSSPKEIVVRKNAKNLIINPSDAHYYTQQEIESHSITPDTFRDRTLQQFKYLSEDFTWFIDEYEHGASAVRLWYQCS